MKITENQKKRLVSAVAKQHNMNEGIVSTLLKYVLAKKLMRDPDIKRIAKNLDKVTKDARAKFDDMEAKGEVKRTPELIALRKSLGIE
jgi:replication initiation and membrane attachment protein DnaB